MPSAENFPRNAWYRETQRGFDFYTDSGRSDLKIPKTSDVVAWFQSAAPEKLETVPLFAASESPVEFRPELLPLPQKPPMVSSLDWSANSGRWPGLRFSDMEFGQLGGVVALPQVTVSTLAAGSNISGTKVFDVDQDDNADLLVFELGSKLPGDHDRGSISYSPGSQTEQKLFPILDHVGRIADASPADFDADGDIDLVVAEFGWQKTGRILVMENQRESDARGTTLTASDFQTHVIDARHGTIHVRVTDINGDSLPDVIALISQEFETVEAFINEGSLKFRREVIMEPQDPAFGSCGIELSDIDGDGDIDVIYCNGDTLDSHLVKPYHGVHLLENKGSFPYSMQRLLTMPGASDSAIADFDGDGDQDIAVSGYLPANLLGQLPTGTYDSLCWLEQVSPRQFEVHSLEVGTIGHLGLVTGDFNEDGRVDIALGDSPGQGWGAIWWNVGSKR
ncbi:MAG: VCBS repeat-containing protein [Planctomycetaceae bacterium]